MRNKLVKTAVVSVAAMLFALVPATQAFAWCGGYCWGGGYYPPAQQRYAPAPQSYSPAQTRTNEFDPTVYDIQEALFEGGYYEGGLDGLLGEQTKAALLSFQEDNDIPQAGSVDVVTLKSDTATLEALGL